MTEAPAVWTSAPRATAGAAPLRRPASLRRTMTLDTRWPNGHGQPQIIHGRARDIITPAEGGAPIVLDSAQVDARISPKREIMEISTIPPRPLIGELVGCRAGGHLRGELARIVGDDLRDGTPLYLLLDDLSGATLVSNWSWSRWLTEFENWLGARNAAHRTNGVVTMENVCMGLASGSPALDETNRARIDLEPTTWVPDLVNPEDVAGWHEMTAIGVQVSARRARRIDIWFEGGLLHIDAGFQDSGMTREGKRQAIHEYRIFAAVTPEDFRLQKIDVQPMTLPYAQCPSAAPHAQKLVGQSIGQNRKLVLDYFKGPAGCTHLNDMLRSLAEVPQLSARLQARLG